MKRLTLHPGYLRMRAILGALYAMFGVIIIVRTYMSFGLRSSEIPALVLGAALAALGFLRVRDYFALRENASS